MDRSSCCCTCGDVGKARSYLSFKCTGASLRQASAGGLPSGAVCDLSMSQKTTRSRIGRRPVKPTALPCREIASYLSERHNGPMRMLKHIGWLESTFGKSRDGSTAQTASSTRSFEFLFSYFDVRKSER